SWLRDGVPVAGRSAATYALEAGDAGHGIACRVRAANVVGAAEATSNTVAISAPESLAGSAGARARAAPGPHRPGGGSGRPGGRRAASVRPRRAGGGQPGTGDVASRPPGGGTGGDLSGAPRRSWPAPVLPGPRRQPGRIAHRPLGRPADPRPLPGA